MALLEQSFFHSEEVVSRKEIFSSYSYNHMSHKAISTEKLTSSFTLPSMLPVYLHQHTCDLKYALVHHYTNW